MAFSRNEKNNLVMCVQSFVVLTPGGKKLVVDTCNGNDRKGAPPNAQNLNTNYLEALGQIGCPADQVTHVMCTHLHYDHIGWNTFRAPDGSFRPTSPTQSTCST